MKKISTIELLESRIAPAGIITAAYDATTKELVLTGDHLDNSLAIFQTGKTTWRIEGKEDAAFINTSINEAGNERLDIGSIAKLTIMSAGGNDRIELTGLRSLKSLIVDTGSGNDTVQTNGLAVRGNVSFATGAGLDSVELDGLTASIAGNLAINDTADGLTFTFGAASSSVVGSVTYTGSSAVDLLNMSTDTVLKIGKQLDFTANGGNDRLEFGSQGTLSIGRDAQGRSVNYTGGNGNDRLSFGASSVRLLGSVEMSGFGGNDTLDLDGLKISLGKSLAGRSVFLSGDTGSDQIDIQGSSVSIAGLVRLDGGPDADTLDLSGAHTLSLKGSASFDGGAGNDDFRLGADALSVLGSLEFLGGDDTDISSIEGDGTIKGPVNINLGPATVGLQTSALASRSGFVAGLKITGALTVNSTGAATSTDSVKLTNLNLGGLLTLTLGDGASTVDLDNLNTANLVSIETRGGNDLVEIERDATFGTSTFRKAATINLGNDNDTLLIGKDSKNNRVNFLSTLTADAGTGTDSRNDALLDNTFLKDTNYIETAFESLVPTV